MCCAFICGTLPQHHQSSDVSLGESRKQAKTTKDEWTIDTTTTSSSSDGSEETRLEDMDIMLMPVVGKSENGH